MKRSTIVFLVVSLLAAGLATGLAVDARRAKAARDEAAAEARKLQGLLNAAEIRLAGAGKASVDAAAVPATVLKDRIAELEQALSRKDAELKNLQAQAQTAEEQPQAETAEAAPPERNPEEWRERQRERMEQLSQEDPEEYKRIQDERREFQTRMVNNLGGQVEFLAGLSTEGLTQEQLENHTLLLERLSAFRAKVSQLNTDPASDEGGVSRRELFQEFREIGPLLDVEREVVLSNLAVDLGYAPSEAHSFVEYVDYINEMTSPRAIMRGLGWGGRGGRGGP